VTKKRWREVFLLTIGMLDSSEALLRLMQARIGDLLEEDEKLQQFLRWLDEKANSIQASCKLSAVRATYFAIYFAINAYPKNNDFTKYHTLACSLDQTLRHAYLHSIDLAFDLALTQNISIELNLNFTHISTQTLACAHAYVRANTLLTALNYNSDLIPDFTHALTEDLIYAIDYNSNLEHKLRSLKEQIPSAKSDLEALNQWWQAHGQTWTRQLRVVMIEHRNIGRDWQFSDAQKERLQQYYDANKLLVDCLNSDCYVSREVRQEIEETLLLPIAEIEKRKQLNR
jgi:predicted NACHT family NTPase